MTGEPEAVAAAAANGNIAAATEGPVAAAAGEPRTAARSGRQEAARVVMITTAVKDCPIMVAVVAEVPEGTLAEESVADTADTATRRSTPRVLSLRSHTSNLSSILMCFFSISKIILFPVFLYMECSLCTSGTVYLVSSCHLLYL